MTMAPPGLPPLATSKTVCGAWTCSVANLSCCKAFGVMVIIDVFTRGFIGFAVERGDIDGVAVRRMFNCALAKHSVPKSLSTDNDPLFGFHRWLTTSPDPRYRGDQDSSISALLASLRRESNPNGPVNVTTKHLTEIEGLIDGGQLRTHVGTVLRLADAREAHLMLEGIRPAPQGKIVFAVETQ